MGRGKRWGGVGEVGEVQGAVVVYNELLEVNPMEYMLLGTLP